MLQKRQVSFRNLPMAAKPDELGLPERRLGDIQSPMHCFVCIAVHVCMWTFVKNLSKAPWAWLFKGSNQVHLNTVWKSNWSRVKRNRSYIESAVVSYLKCTIVRVLILTYLPFLNCLSTTNLADWFSGYYETDYSLMLVCHWLMPCAY